MGNLLSIAIERARLYARSVELGAVEERARLARELHDTVAQGLTATALQLESADALLDADQEAGLRDERIHASVRRALELTRATLEEVRRTAMTCAPRRLKAITGAALRLAKREPLLHGMAARLVIKDHPAAAPERIYRIVQSDHEYRAPRPGAARSVR